MLWTHLGQHSVILSSWDATKIKRRTSRLIGPQQNPTLYFILSMILYSRSIDFNIWHSQLGTYLFVDEIWCIILLLRGILHLVYSKLFVSRMILLVYLNIRCICTLLVLKQVWACGEVSKSDNLAVFYFSISYLCV